MTKATEAAGVALEELCLDTPAMDEVDSVNEPAAKKAPKKKRKKKSAATTTNPAHPAPPPELNNVLISRSKHLKYISSYHGNWLHLPPALVDIALECNEEARIDYRKMLSEERRALTSLLVEARAANREQTSERASAKAPARIDYGANTPSATGPTIAEYAASVDTKLPKPVDDGALRNVMEIRRLIDAAGDLIVRATSGMTAAELKAMNDPFEGGGLLSNAIANSNVRSNTVSAVRQNRLRAMAISHIAQAFRIDEIATSVVLMQSATAFDEIAQKVLRADPASIDAAYVMYYQQRIPSRTLCQSTSPHILDPIIAATPMAIGHLPALYRSRGVLHLYRQDFAAAIRDFTDGLRIVRLSSSRKAHRTESRSRGGGGGGKKKGHRRAESKAANGDELGQAAEEDELFDTGHAPGDDIGRQLLFSRGMAYFLWASAAIEEATLAAYGLTIPIDGLSNEGGELSVEGAGFKLDKACRGIYDERARPGEADKLRSAFAEGTQLHRDVGHRLRHAVRDHEHFQAHFPLFEAPPGTIHHDARQEAEEIAGAARASAIDRSISFRGRRLVHARALTGRTQASTARDDGLNPDSALFTSYHPMLGESIFTQLLANLLLGEMERVLTLHYRAARIMAGLDTIIDGRAFFLLGRSLSQSEYHEVFERLTNTWLADRADAGTSPPQGDSEDSYIAQGPLASLAHVASFFSVEYEAQLYARFTSQEKEAEEARLAHPEAQRLLSLLDGKPSGGKPAPPPKSHGLTAHTTARAEIALAYLRAGVIGPLEERQPLPPAIVSGASASGSNLVSVGGSGSGKGKGKAVD